MRKIINFKKNAFVKGIYLTLLTIITIFCCNGIYAYGMDIDTLTRKYERLEKENERLEKLIEQYSTLVNGLLTENENLKEELENKENDNEELMTYLGEFTITHYCVEQYPHTCGGGGSTASGTQVMPYHTVAVDTSVIPFGTKLYIENVGYRIAEDTGGNINGNRLDLAVSTHEEALNLGRMSGVKVWIVE